MARMTDAQKYDELLKDLGELLASKNATIQWQDYTIADLKRKLEAAEAEIAELHRQLPAKQEGGAA